MKSMKVELVLLVIVVFITVAANEAPLAYGEKNIKGSYLYPPIYPKSNGTYDGWILESGENTNVGGTINSTGTILNIGDDALRRQYVAILQFNTASYNIPSAAIIYKAVLRIRPYAPVGSNPFLSFGSLYIDMRKPYFGTSSLVPSDFQAIAGRNSVSYFGKYPVAGWYKADLNATARAYLNKSGTTQFRLHFKLDDNNDFKADYVRIYSGNAALSLRPKLEINYYIP